MTQPPPEPPTPGPDQPQPPATAPMDETQPTPYLPPSTPPAPPASAAPPAAPVAPAAPAAPAPGWRAPTGPVPTWYGDTAPLPTAPALTASPSGQSGPAPLSGSGSAFSTTPAPAATQPRSRRWVDVALAAVVAAVVASGTTAAIVHHTDKDNGGGSSTALSSSGSSAPVVQASSNAPDWATTASAVQASVVAITVGSQSSGSEAQGSGIILDTAGHILTNNHVATATSGPLTVTLTNQSTYKATIVGTDPSTDLAVIKLTNPPTDLKPASLGDSGDLKVGQPVMAIGNPLGLADTVTTGIVSALDRPVTTQNDSQSENPDSNSSGDQVITNAIQTDAAINPGNSGGALVTAAGQVVGINSSIASLGNDSAFGGDSESGSIGLGFAIPINEAKNVAQQLITTGTVKHPYLGVSLSDGSVASGGAQRAAALVADVQSGTPADNAGLKKGDAVIAVNGDPVNGALSLTAQVRADAVGQTVKLTVVRDGKQQTISVTLAARPASAG